jgi:acetyltransferase-like isoleucine patch superfamily enzyme
LAFVALRTAYFFLLRIFVCEPLFKAYCASYGSRVRTSNFIHWISGEGRLVIGDDVLIDGKSSFQFASLFDQPPVIEIGSRTTIGHRCDFVAARRIIIGTDCLIAGEVRIFDSPGHPKEPAERLANAPPSPDDVKPVTIGNNVWIGARAMIFPGVTIGDGSIVSAGAVVMSSVAPYTLVGGHPARKVLGLTGAATPTTPAPGSPGANPAST